MKSKAIDEYGTKRWRLPNYKYHREDGPVIEYMSGHKSWYLNNIQYSEKEYKSKMRSIKLKKLI